jgi:hypothetical protein
MKEDKDVGFEYLTSPDSSYSGLTYGQWTVKWWQWAVSIPAGKNPLLDDRGVNVSMNQPRQDVWFLAGVWAQQKQTHFPSRKCSIPSGTALLIPILNCEGDFIELPEMKKEDELLDYVSKQVLTVDKKECFVDDLPIPPQRVKSDPQFFELDVHPDFDRYHKGGGRTRATSDGYWVFLKPLPEGKHTIRFAGSYYDRDGNNLVSGASYEITVGK